MKYNGSDATKVDYTYDSYNRITNRAVTNGAAYSTAYSYVPGSTANSTTPLIQNITHGSGANALNFSYTYDNRGNITSETRNGVTVSYEYDQIGQLARVNDPNDKTAGETGTTWLYTYDRGGNILSKAAYVYTTGTVGTAVRVWPYVYGDSNWKDKLTSFDGHTITYDAIGNPLNDGTWAYEWQAGRRLNSMTNPSTGVTLEFTYNHAGLRTKKVKKVNGEVTETTEYIWNGKRVVSLINDDDTLYFFYDAQGKVSMLNYNGTMYSYVHNLLGDIVGIVDSNGVFVVGFSYDVWGNQTDVANSSSSILEKLNPFRYREYIWDSDIELYYLNARFYNPGVSKFINTDVITENASTSRFDLDLFAYCANDPVNRYDPEGKKWWHWALAVAIVAVTAVAVVATAGGVTAGAVAVASVCCGSVATTSGASIASGVLIGEVVGLVGATVYAIDESKSISDISEYGEYALEATIIGGVIGAIDPILKETGNKSFKVDPNKVENNPLDEYVTIGPKDGQVNAYLREIQSSGSYEPMQVIRTNNGTFQLVDGHHRMQALKNLGYNSVWVNLSK